MMHSTAIAQSILSSISGTVTDSAGHVVAGAKIVAHETATGVDQSKTTNEAGLYAFVDLLPGTYVITVSKQGFKDEQSGAIILISAQSVKFNAPLQVGNATETIEVTSAPPTINTENGQLDEIVTGQDARRDAISRSIFALLATNSSSVAHGSTTMVGGQRANYGNFTIDGVTTQNNLYGGTSGGMTADQSFESIAEVKVTDSNGAADTPGFGTVISTTKSGTNNLHGSAFYTTDNSALNANPFFSTSKSIGPELQWYGGSVGGPVRIPKVYDGRNKTFFFVTWEHRTFPLAAGNTTFSVITLPSANFEAGNFSQLLTGTSPTYISNPSTGVNYTNNTIGGTGPFSTVSSVAQAFQANYFPAPPSTFAYQDYSYLKSSEEHINREDYKIDHHFSERSILSGRYTRQYDPQPDNYDSGTGILGHSKISTYNNAYVSHTYTFTPNLVNELRASFAKDERDYEPFHNGAQVLAKTGLEGITVAASVQGFPAIYFGSSNIEQMYENPSQTAVSYSYQLLDNINLQKGHHSIKTGISLTDTRPRSANGNGTLQLGTLNFSGFASGFDYADFLLGIPSSVSLNENPPNRYNRAINTGVYGQDTWTVSPKLSVTLGLRWDYYQPPVDSNDRRANFDPYFTSAAGYVGGIVLPNAKAKTYLSPALPTVVSSELLEISPAGFPGRSMLYGNKTNFGPRLGVAYQIDPRTVIRGGWGIYYGILITSVQDNLAGGGVFGTSLSATNILTDGVPAFTFPNPFGAASTSTGNLACTSKCGLSVTGVDPHLKTPTTQEYNLTIERDLGRQTVAKIGYRGFDTTKLPYTIDLTIPQAGSNNNAASNLTLSQYPLYSKVTWTKSGAVSRENSMEAEITRKFSGGLTYQFEYALTKNLTDDNGTGAGDGEGDSPENPYNLKADYGNTDFIPRHRFTANTVYDLPVGKGKQFGKNMPAALDYAIGGWEASQLFVFQTGYFLTPYYSGNIPDGLNDGKLVAQNIRTDGANLRPNCSGRSFGVPNATRNQWFNNTPWWNSSTLTVNPLAVFTPPAVGQYGNCGTGIIQGPGLWSTNIQLAKSVPLGEKVHLKFQAEMMNAFNHPNWGNPNMNTTASTSSSFGVIGESINAGAAALDPTVTSVNGERHIWLGMRIDF
jgi:hypothetical protein